MAKSKLGRGLLSIITELNSEAPTVEASSSQGDEVSVSFGVKEVLISLIDINPYQPRKSYDERALGELADSIRHVGVLQPLILTQNANRYTIIAGERRYRASILAGLNSVPAIIKELTLLEQKEIALIENLQREDLNPIDEAEAYFVLIQEYGITQEELSKALGKSRPAITNSLRLLALEPQVKEMVRNGVLSAGHAKALAGVKDTALQVELATIAAKRGMSVRALEAFIKASLGEKTPKAKTEHQPSLELRGMVRDMEKIFDTKVKVSGNDSKGKLIIEYYTQNDLERIFELIERIKDTTDE